MRPQSGGWYPGSTPSRASPAGWPGPRPPAWTARREQAPSASLPPCWDPRVVKRAKPDFRAGPWPTWVRPRLLLLLEQAQLVGSGHGLQLGVRGELLQDALDVRPDGGEGDVQLFGDRVVVEA